MQEHLRRPELPELQAGITWCRLVYIMMRKLLHHAQIMTAMAIVLAASWSFVAWITLDMSHPFVRQMMPGDTSWSLVTVGAVFMMWAGMMVAMMLPSAAPMILTFDTFERGRVQSEMNALRTLHFAGAYLAMWVAFAALATGLQWGLLESGLLAPMIVSRSDWMTAGLLVLAGLYQLTPLKHACLQQCRTPIGFLVTEWREGTGGAWTMGPRNGAYCVGCCWALMLLLFVAGVMNPVWIVILSMAVGLEKWPRLPEWLPYGFAGVLFVASVAALI